MACARFKTLLSRYIDGRLSADETRLVEEHLSGCPDCSRELQALREARELIRSKERLSPPPDMDFSFSKRLGDLNQAWHPMSSPYARPLAAAVVLVCCAAFLYLTAPLAVVSNPQGTVKVYLAKKNEWIMMEGSCRVGRRDIVKTFQGSQVDIAMPRVCSIRLKSNTEVSVGQLGSRITGSDIRYSVTKGKILVFHRQGAFARNPFRIETPHAVNTALGTDFMVSVIPAAQKTWVGVLDGSVTVKSLASPIAGVTVRAGQKTEVYAGRLPESPTALMDEEWNEIQELYQIGEKPQVALLISTGEHRARELLRPCPLFISDNKDSPIPALLKETVGVFNQAIREKSAEKHLEAIGRFEDIVATFPDKKYDPQFLLFIGAYYYYLGRYEDAIDSFEKVASGYPDSPFASLAYAVMGIVYEEKLNDPPKALSAYQTILSKYPESPETAEARLGISRISR